MSIEINVGEPITLSEFANRRQCYYYNEQTDYVWLKYERFSAIKYPVFNFNATSADEIKFVFKITNAKVLTYAQLSDNNTNGYWYVCKSFSENNIRGNFKRNVALARKNLVIKAVSKEEFLLHGFSPFSESRIRKGLNDYTIDDFNKRFIVADNLVEHKIIGAYLNNELVAYIPFLMFDTFIEVEGPYAKTNVLRYCPNDLLILTALECCLNQYKIPIVSYGFSTIQEKNIENSLHEFKLKVGFEAIPIKRHFIFNPKLKLLFNPLTELMVNFAGMFLPKNKQIKKIKGVFNNTK